MRDDERLRHVPIAIGGPAHSRGVIATCNYPARAFGIHSAMSSARALQLCPSLQILKPNMEKYRQASNAIFSIYQRYTTLIEPLSLDEAYLDVSHSQHQQGSATRIAQSIRADVEKEIGITISAGVAPNKFLAKIASDWNKPNGLFVIRPQDVDAFMLDLPVKKLFGVGKVTAAKMQSLAIHRCADLQQWEVTDLSKLFGIFGERLHELSFGIDHRPVNPERRRKSVSIETTYPKDIHIKQVCLDELPLLLEKLKLRIARHQCEHHIHKLFVKVRFSDFTSTTKECVYPHPELQQFIQLMDSALQRKSLAVRLLGLGVRLGAAHSQFELF